MERGTIGCGSRCGCVDESYVESCQARRCKNIINQALYDPSKRKMITLGSCGFSDPKEVNKTARDDLWAHFKHLFQWEVVTDGLVREVWEDTIKNRYPDIMFKLLGRHD
nr:hypothetical protein [Tanacetum cinerariifolium]